MPKNTNSQTLIVVVASLVVLVAAAFSATFFIGDMSLGGSDSKGYKNVTFTDAVVLCDQETKDKFGSQIKTLMLDSHSSRYDQQEFVFKIFQNVDLKTKKPHQTALHYVNCFVKSSNGRIAKYEAFEHKDAKNQVIRSDDVNMFGYPKKK